MTNYLRASAAPHARCALCTGKIQRPPVLVWVNADPVPVCHDHAVAALERHGASVIDESPAGRLVWQTVLAHMEDRGEMLGPLTARQRQRRDARLARLAAQDPAAAMVGEND